ncbi:bifunctional DNA-binding transcriptional regulator/O6-methylguanine-DNA methyltransferase Ada [Pseudanabaena sp. UWO310]|uniref:bifunctional DNA-binding transcriptional regulator/O6-methylguanine-DNA methyltransferase Ada n=1 Tax=Pseudanabaena sp. UWO310 TaxID=2480795 RepID=UPI0011586E20|nr:bifunctional DNA-binding transcriptional regulator/O6-methylguanine-DNA methyltransferase Ada [Pseudanabaena sp. UWO310]TYQ26568.1 bifunctional DNA-binding transcriptional regulator/O6-methylguanine-DNA methyltransferase Ada [Pseudanabaena sp. UWO310]
MTQFTASDRRWEAIIASNPPAEGANFYAVKTTGIYCRPQCKSRIPKPNNIQFFATTTEAEAAGFRPCKRCQPHTDSPQTEREQLIAKICKTIEASAEMLSLNELAQMAGLSPYHFQRVFKQIVGVTPKDYAKGDRAKRLRDRLPQDRSITNTLYAVGYESSSSFYTEAPHILGMKPKEYKQGAQNQEIRLAIENTKLGWVIVAATELGVCAIALGDNPDELVSEIHRQFPQAKFCNDNLTFQAWVADVVAAIAMPQRSINLPLDIQGTAFQQQVWQVLQSIPLGSTLSYQQVANQMGKPKAVRAVASACAANKIAIAIPCHRVVGSNGSLSGYRWGVARKQALLELEKQWN